jgi:hypothetical protein
VKRSVCICTQPLATSTPTILALALGRQQSIAWNWHTHTVLICWLTIGAFSISTTIPKLLSGCMGEDKGSHFSMKASVILRVNYIPVINISILISQTQQGSTNQHLTYYTIAPTSDTACTPSCLIAVRQHLQRARTQFATISIANLGRRVTLAAGPFGLILDGKKTRQDLKYNYLIIMLQGC